MCKKIVSNDAGGGYELCDTCWPETDSVASYGRPEPEENLTSLPVWHEHPDAACYREFPFSKLQEQRGLAMRCQFSRQSAILDNVPPQAAMYTCFICGREHDAAAALNPPLAAPPDPPRVIW